MGAEPLVALRLNSAARIARGLAVAHCSDAAADDVTAAAESVAAVGAVWARVSATLESTRKVYLLYWRGVLGQCLDQEAKALDDLTAFLGAREDSPMWSSLVDDAKRRVRQLERKLGRSAKTASPATPAIVIGSALGVGAAGAGGLSAWQWSESQQVATEMANGVHIGQDIDGWLVDGARAADASHALVGAAAGLGTAAVVSFVVAGVRGGGAPARVSRALVPWVQPGPGSVTIGFGGEW